MSRVQKINVVLIFLVIIGTIFANINVITSITPANVYENIDGNSENQNILTDYNDLDSNIILEISEYILNQANNFDFKISKIVYSAGLIIETQDTLIVIGHGYFDSDSQYFIGDYSKTNLVKMADSKDAVALLSCYSANVELENNKQLTFLNKIDVVSAMNELFVFLNWKETMKFIPTYNIQLFDLDPGGGNGWSLSNPPPNFNLLQRAHSFDGDFHKYWNLLTASGIRSLSTYMMSHKYRTVDFTLKGEFLTQVTPNQNSYYINEITLKFDSWVHVESDMCDYIAIEEIYVDGDFQRFENYDYKVDDLLNLMMSSGGIANRVTALGIMAATFVTIGIFLIGKALHFMKIAIAVTVAGAMTEIGLSVSAVSWLAGIAGILGLLLIIAAIAIVIAAVVIAFNW